MHLTKKQNWIDDLVEILKCRLKYPTTDLKEVYEDIEEDIYLCVNGEHFDEDLAKQAVSEDDKCRWYNWREMEQGAY